jgi:hypothetical protein
MGSRLTRSAWKENSVQIQYLKKELSFIRCWMLGVEHRKSERPTSNTGIIHTLLTQAGG